MRDLLELPASELHVALRVVDAGLQVVQQVLVEVDLLVDGEGDVLGVLGKDWGRMRGEREKSQE